MDDKLKCIILKWERHKEEEEGNEKENVYALCHFDSVQDRVDVVQSTALVQLLHDSIMYVKALIEHFKKSKE